MPLTAKSRAILKKRRAAVDSTDGAPNDVGSEASSVGAESWVHGKKNSTGYRISSGDATVNHLRQTVRDATRAGATAADALARAVTPLVRQRGLSAVRDAIRAGRSARDALSCGPRYTGPGDWPMGKGIDARVGDDWSPEAREAAAKARASHAHHTEQAAHHAQQAKEQGENVGKPPKGSHAEVSSHHGSAAFYHKALAEAHETNSGRQEELSKKATRASNIANTASKKLASGKTAYPIEKENNWQAPTTTLQQQQAKRISRYLSENRGRR